MKKLLLIPMAVMALSAVAPSAFAAPAAPSVVRIAAVKTGLAYNLKTVTAKAGKVKIVFTNLSPIQHNVRIESGETELGGTKVIGTGVTTATVTLKKGTYHFYCSVPGHEDAGMSGSLKVT